MSGSQVTMVALLRGINLARNKRVGMADLRELLVELGYERVRTHLQSGNVILSSSQDPEGLVRALERAIAGRFGFDVDVIVRTAPELAAIVAANPHAGIATDPARQLVMFLPAEADPDALAALSEQDHAPELLSAHGRELYLWCPGGQQDSKLLRALGRAGLAGAGTVRNWNTVTKLLELAEKG